LLDAIDVQCRLGICGGSCAYSGRLFFQDSAGYISTCTMSYAKGTSLMASHDSCRMDTKSWGHQIFSSG